MKKLSKFSTALWLTSALASMPAYATVQLLTAAGCGDRGFQSGVTVASACNNEGSAYTADFSSNFDYRIQANAATGYELGGLRTYGQVTFDGLLRGRVGAPSSNSAAGTNAIATMNDTLRFNVADAAQGETLTMRSAVRMHGGYDTTTIDESKFYDGNFASMRTTLSVQGLGYYSGEFFSSVNIGNKAITTFGSSDNTLVFEQTLTRDNNGLYYTDMQMQLITNLSLVNGYSGSVGVGSGELTGDFMGTAGVMSIDLFNSQGQRLDYTLTSDDGDFAFLTSAIATPVSEPSSAALMLLGLGVVSGFAQRKRRNKAAATA